KAATIDLLQQNEACRRAARGRAGRDRHRFGKRLVAALSFREQLLEPQNRIWFLTSSFASPFEEKRVRRAGRRGNTGHDIRVLHNCWSRKILTMRIVFAG